MMSGEARVVTSFERAFEDTEKAAASTLQSANEVVKWTRKLQRAAKEGNIARMRSARSGLDTALGVLGQAVVNASASWPFDEKDEERYLEDLYPDELRAVAKGKDLDVYERDGQLICSPTIVRILPGDRAVRLDRKKVSAVRPSYVADLLRKKRQERSRYSSGAFLESLYHVYSALRAESSARLMLGDGPVVPLIRVYKLLTALPGAAREYGETDFSRDLYMLEANGPKRTKRGASVEFPASTGTRQSGRGLFAFVGPDGQERKYYGIMFSGEG